MYFTNTISAPTRWKSDENMLSSEMITNGNDISHQKEGKFRTSFLRGKKNTWVNICQKNVQGLKYTSCHFLNSFLFFFQLRSSFSKAFGRNKSSGNLSEENGISASKLNSTTNGVHSELRLQSKVHFTYDKTFFCIFKITKEDFFVFQKMRKKPLLHTKKDQNHEKKNI